MKINQVKHTFIELETEEELTTLREALEFFETRINPNDKWLENIKILRCKLQAAVSTW